jgi:acyl-CoA synthetase (AMP-forming)/AMP-acid ligase II
MASRIDPELALIGDLPFENGAEAAALALVLPNASLTMGELRDEATRYARAFLALGTEPGDRVAIYGFPSPELVSAIFGLAMIGAVIVPANSRYQPYELEYLVGHADVSGIVTTSEGDRNLIGTAELVRSESMWVLDLARGVVAGSQEGALDEFARQRSPEQAHERRAAVRRPCLDLLHVRHNGPAEGRDARSRRRARLSQRGHSPRHRTW